MATERYLSRRIPNSRAGNNIGKIDKNTVPSIYVPAYSNVKTSIIVQFYQKNVHDVCESMKNL